MADNNNIRGLMIYLTKLSHNVDYYKFKFINVHHSYGERNSIPTIDITYDLEITTKENDIPYLWDFFNCKSKHILEDACKLTDVNYENVRGRLNKTKVNDVEIDNYGGYLPKSFIQKISNDIKQKSPKKIFSHFFCGGEKKELILNVTYEVSEVFIDDGITTDISVYCGQVLADGEPLENIPQYLAETIVGYISDDDKIRYPSDTIVWDSITKYMGLEECEIWTHTYTFIINIGNIEIDDYNYVNHSTFSSKLCDFISGDY